MKTRILPGVSYAVAAVMLLAACQPNLPPAATSTAPKPSSTAAPTATRAIATATPSPIPSATTEQETAALQALTKVLAQQSGQPESAIKLTDARQVDWTDSCFGLGGPNESCLQAITPGYELTFEVNGTVSVVRSDLTGESYRLVSGSVPDSVTPGAPAGLEGFQTAVTQSLLAGELERMRGLMSDPFTFTYWKTDGPITTRDEALVLIKDALAQRGNLAFEPYDVIQKLNWREYADDGSKLVSALRVKGWQASAPEAEALLLIYERPSGSHVWTALVISNVGLP